MHHLPFLLLLALLRTTLSLHHFLNSPFAHSTLTKCLPPGSSTFSKTVTCSHACALAFRRHVPYATTSYLVSRLKNGTHFRYHFYTRKPHLAPHEHVIHLPQGKYRLTLRANNPRTQRTCGIITYALQRQFSNCQIVLPQVLEPTPTPSTTPSPSTTPKSSLTPTPTPTPTPTTVSNSFQPIRTSQTSAARQVSPRIVGGNIPDPSLRTHMVAFVSNGAFICSGSVISPRWAITAAHCRVSRGMLASVGGSHVTTGTFRTVQAAFPHSGFDFSRTDSPFDISLILFSDPVPEGTTFIRVNTNASIPEPGAYARVAGYGDTVQKSSLTLRQVDIPVVSMSRCKRDYSRANPGIAARLNPDVQLCAGLREGGCDACQGDSGGPLALFDSAGHLVQVGVVSFGIGCARAAFPGVYTRLSSFEQWMNDTGAGYIRSTDGVTVLGDGSAEAIGEDRGFSIAGLSTTQTILLLCGIALVGAVLVFMGVTVILRSRRRRSDAPAPPVPGESTIENQDESGGYQGYDGNWHAQGLYPVYGPEHQYAGYASAPMQPHPVYRDAEGIGETQVEDIRYAAREEDNALAPNTTEPGVNSSPLYPANTVIKP